MIEVNLLGNKKPFRLPKVLGVDFNILNLKLVLLAVITGHFINTDYWKAERDQTNKEIMKLDRTFKKLNVQAKKSKKIQAEIDQFLELEKKLLEKLKIVKKIIKIKRNPYKILLYVSKNIPSGVWLTSLKLDDNEFVIDGSSVSYKDIGQFIEKLKSSIFFNNTLRLSKSRTRIDEKSGRRIENFQIKGMIERYD